jgi:ABC-2 type transport system permease protein
MSVYLAIAAKSFQRHLAYRAANLAGILTNTFFGAVYVFLYIALFQAREAVGGLTLQDTITYAVISQSLLMVMSAFGNQDLSEAIIKGEIISDLSRPVDFYALWAAIDIGRAVYYIIFRGLPTLAISWVLFHPSPPAGPAAALLFLPAIALGMSISFALRFTTNSLAFWTTDVRGVHYLTQTLVLFLAGFIVPLNFFPPGLRLVAQLLPFQTLANLPINLYLGKLSATELTRQLLLNLAWLAVLVTAGQFTLRSMLRRLTTNGG